MQQVEAVGYAANEMNRWQIQHGKKSVGRVRRHEKNKRSTCETFAQIKQRRLLASPAHHKNKHGHQSAYDNIAWPVSVGDSEMQQGSGYESI
jgi:hypothetical protein